jgi:NADH:ubiquinone oxidoreductase subunit C
LNQLAGSFDNVTWEEPHGQDVARVPNETWLEFAAAAKDAGFEMCVDVTAVDWLRSREHRYEVVANLLSISEKTRLRMITTVGRDEPTVASTTCSASPSTVIPI